MEAARFQLYKVQRAIRTNGATFSATIPAKNEYNEPITEGSHQTFRGLYHESTSFIAKTTSDSSTTRRKSSPMILCELQDVQSIPLGSVIAHNGKTYEVVEIKDLAEAGIIGDMSLEEIQHGNGV